MGIIPKQSNEKQHTVEAFSFVNKKIARILFVLTKRPFHVNRCERGVIHIYHIRRSEFNVQRSLLFFTN